MRTFGSDFFEAATVLCVSFHRMLSFFVNGHALEWGAVYIKSHLRIHYPDNGMARASRFIYFALLSFSSIEFEIKSCFIHINK